MELSLKCPICNNQFAVDGPLQPKILKCGHTFCANCLWRITNLDENVIKCPLCFGITPVGALGAYALPVNQTVVDLLLSTSLQESLEGGRTTPVDFCCYCNTEVAEMICFGCDPAGCKLCDQCCMVEHDRPFPPVKLHKPLKIDEVINLPKNFCAKHEQALMYHSAKAGVFGCKQCLVEWGDNNLEFLPINVAFQTVKQYHLPLVTEELERYLKRLQLAQHRIETTQAQLGVTKSKVMQEILKKFSNYHIIFQERKNTLLANLETEVRK